MTTTDTQAKNPSQKGLVAKFLGYMIESKPDLLFGMIRNTRPNLVMPGNGPVFITRFNDVQEVLNLPDIFNVTYGPMIDPCVGPFMLGRDCTTINQRDKGIMKSLMQREDLPFIREKVASLVNEAVEHQIQNQKIEIVNTVSRWVPLKLTGEYFGFPGPDMKSMFRWSLATQLDMFHNLDNDSVIHQNNIDAGHEMKAYLHTLIPERREALQKKPEMDDILSRLLKSHFPEAIHFDDERIVANIMGTLVGGVETTSQAVVQILDQLFKRPKILEQAIKAAKTDDNHLLYQYCWEALRFNPINPFVVRRCVRDYKIARGTLRSATIKAGSLVFVSTRSAMKDGRQIPAASQFCIDRPAYHYLHMGHGMHTCLGDQLSRVQIPEIVKRILKLPNVRPSSAMDFKGGPFPESYSIEFDSID
ncbi:cytochrome P450 [Neptunomonas japonica]|uniref:Cytochrome P450 n=1 Tax=Neptunomonas japonica JAMM 1380 TaxID=1441457 RepID=A0A7R6PAQ7_9GAMM|nr:cytochrome P450 [Neptunomonas japonica]BBB29019.1 cytochrome P450 [Neptunomonas japonica JAMM 1380]